MAWLGFLRLAIFRAGPQDMPASWQATGRAVLWFLLCGMAVVFVSRDQTESMAADLLHGLFDNVLDAVIIVAYAWGWVTIRKFPARLPQLLTALFGALGVLSLVLAGLWWLQPIHPGAPSVRDWWIVLLFVWDVLVVGQLFRLALNLGAVLGALISLGYFILSGVGVVWVHALIFG